MTRLLLLALLAAAPLTACAREQAASESAPAAASPGAQAATAWLAENKAKPGVVTTPSGLQYSVVASGPKTGTPPKEGDLMRLHYEGALTDGTVFDSSYQRGAPAVMPLQGLVPGWMEALPLMRPGDTWMLYTPPELGYGSEGAGGVIPPDAVLVFKVELIDVLPR